MEDSDCDPAVDQVLLCFLQALDHQSGATRGRVLVVDTQYSEVVDSGPERAPVLMEGWGAASADKVVENSSAAGESRLIQVGVGLADRGEALTIGDGDSQRVGKVSEELFQELQDSLVAVVTVSYDAVDVSTLGSDAKLSQAGLDLALPVDPAMLFLDSVALVVLLLVDEEAREEENEVGDNTLKVVALVEVRNDLPSDGLGVHNDGSALMQR